MTELPSDAQLSRDYDPSELVAAQRAALDAEERRVATQPTVDDPGDDYDVAPPIDDDDDAGYDPTPSPTS